MYKDLEMHKEAIASLEKAIQIHKEIINVPKTSKSRVSMVSPNSMIPAELERSEIMKMLAEQLVFDGRTEDGIKVAYEALEIQENFFHGMVNTNVQETMLLLAETLTIGSQSKQVDEAIELYTRVLESR